MELNDALTVAHRALDERDAQGALTAITLLLEQHSEAPIVRWTAGRYFGLMKAYSEAAGQYKLAVQGDPSLSHVEFAVGGKVVRLRDVSGSPWAAGVLEEFARGMYGLADLAFSAGDVALDVGAHIGGVSVILAVLHPDIRIVAYEPSSTNFAMLCANLHANGVTNVMPVHQAVMGDRGEMTLTWTPQDTAGATVGLSAESRLAREAAGWSSETVPCVTLDDVFTAHEIDRCSWLKLDCEGAEWSIAANTGMLERIDRCSLELHLPFSRQAEGGERLSQEFASLLRRVPKPPHVEVVSTLWLRDI